MTHATPVADIRNTTIIKTKTVPSVYTTKSASKKTGTTVEYKPSTTVCTETTSKCWTTDVCTTKPAGYGS